MSDDVREEIRSAVSAILRRGEASASGPGGFDGLLWKGLSETGFHLLGVPEESGGSGGTLRDLAVVVDLTAFHAADVPVAETAFLAGWLLAQAGLPLPEGLVVASLDEARGQWRNGTLRLSGRLRTPWGRHADHVVTLVKCGEEVLVTVVPVRRLADPAVVRADNLAGEPRDTLVLEDFEAGGAVAPAPLGVDTAAVSRRGALARSVQLAAAARAVLESTLRHVTEREQFGRPLARFQAVQQHVAALAAEAAMMRVGADAAVLAVEAQDNADLAVAAAKATASAGTQVVTALGHQLHGALGYSREHHLGRVTTRMWSWRDEFGSESYWQDRLAARVGAGGDWWPLVTGGER
ncbi:acyl-CoA dehydrogenase family protein [Streptomyces sp. NPDC058374]|uniref:acyl-CoA dehydrogenase family protein n=1 Tax=unclassified Streptomyces TaxID=2593676 RepID=UPI0036508F3E